MSHDFVQKRYWSFPSQKADLATVLVDFGGSTGVVAAFAPPVPIEILRFGIIVDSAEALDVGVSFSIDLIKYPTAGSSTNAVTIGTITRTADVAAGGVVVNNLDAEPAQTSGDDTLYSGTTSQTSLVNTAPRDRTTVPTKYQIMPGQQVVFDLTDAADTAGKGYVFIEYVERGWVDADVSNLIEVTE